MVNLWDIKTLVCYMFDMAAIAPAPFISRSNDLMMCNDPLCHVATRKKVVMSCHSLHQNKARWHSRQHNRAGQADQLAGKWHTQSPPFMFQKQPPECTPPAPPSTISSEFLGFTGIKNIKPQILISSLIF